MDDIKLAQLVSSRLCHDLIAPVGAIKSGLELLEEVEDKAEVMSLIAQSAETVVKRLTYFRATFGYAAANNFSSFSDIQKYISDFILSQNITITWTKTCQIKDVPAWGRFIANAVLILVEIAPYGGKIAIQINAPNGNPTVASFILSGDILSLRKELVETLEGRASQEDISPKNVQAYLTYRLGKNLGLLLEIEQSHPGEVSIKASVAESSRASAVS